MDNTRRQFRQPQPQPTPSSRALYISRTKPKTRSDTNFDFADKMARAKAAMLAREQGQQHRPLSSASVPEIVITPTLEPIVESDDEK